MTDKEALQCKVVLIGESGVGKTSIINRYAHNEFNEIETITPGASFIAKTIFLQDYNQSIKFEIWDTAGQEKYRALAKVFYKNAAVCVLVYDITRKKSFEELKNYWYNQIKQCASPNIVIGIAANKCDLYDNEQVSEDEARAFADKIGAVFNLTSAQTNTGIEDLFKGVGCKVLDPNYNIDGGSKKDNNIKLNAKNDDSKKKKKKCC